jgi:dipeptidyl aminopeptidase/acylaminoacyl peptidase
MKEVVAREGTELVPREVLFGNPERTNPRLSPDGDRLAWVAPRDGVLNVWVAHASAEGVDWGTATPVTADTARGIRVFEWAWDGRHLLYVQDTTGDENRHLFAVDVETLARRDLTPFDGVQARIIAIRKRHPGQMLVGLNLDNPRLHDVYRVEVATGELTKEADNPGYVGWLADEDLVVRAALAPLPRGGFDLMVRDSPSARWRQLLTIPAEDVPPTGLLAFSGDGSSLLTISSLDSDTGRLTQFDLATGERRELAGGPEADVVGVMLHPDSRDPQVVAVLKDRMMYGVLDPSVKADFEAVSGLSPGDWELIGRSRDDTVWLVSFSDDKSPATCFRYDRTSRTGRLLFDSRPDISRYRLANMEPFSYTARDGLTIHGYVTFPPGGQRFALPAVVSVHGGPQARTAWKYDSETQWLANRGYLCVQVNFRGSTGYGKAFVTAADREWGGKMQDDLTDAVGYVIEQGWADPKRVAIYGRSYGGYAALAGAAFTPDLFCCAVDIVGPSNLKTMLAAMPLYWAPMAAQLHRRIGNPETDGEFLWDRSPLSRIADIRIPILIAQGANDPRVKQAESEQIVAALTGAGIDHEYILFPDEGHCFDKPKNRLTFYDHAERFLARHLGGRFQA